MSEVKRYYSFFTSHPGDWHPCSKEHHDMVRADPQAWPGYEVRELAVIPEGHVVVQRELLERLYSSDTATALMAAAELRSLLNP
ncbi:hypothetical protein [Pseudomonas aeruginosa]|uniref:hypothetical protein n=1 Tax=Pseudomonas aeruginosa TaxID=287 RepID=UPI0008066C15|nr:hypothetical protein [Pseudomonas aeruginosa]OBY45896.1 hypothetical protein A9Z48_27945 [Pseudomonas aeruginosa]